MNRDQMLLRHGYYCGLAERLLRDESYTKRWLGRAHHLTENQYLEEIQEIEHQLVEHGFIQSDQDPWVWW
jgi:hypothetical protein